MKRIFCKVVLLFTFAVSMTNLMYATGTNTKYAVIINGGGNSTINYVRYWNDCSAVYQTLIQKGYSDNLIYVVMSDGTVNNYNNSNQAACFSLSLNLDGYGDDDIQYAATIENIYNIFDNLSSNMTSEDDLSIYVTGLGGRNTTTGHSFIVLWGDTILDVDFAQLLSSLHYRTINVVMQQSYSGGFIDDLIGLDNIVVTTACNATEDARPMAHNDFSEFTYRWVSAISGNSPYDIISCDACSISNPYQHNVRMADCNVSDRGDHNYDGYVSMEEAFHYVKQYDQSKEHPQIESNPGCLSQTLALDELLYSNNCSASLIQGWDLYMKDNPYDYGDEPNLSTNEHWLTEDIWFEENGELVESLQSGETYDFCVRVSNRGSVTSPSNAILYAHWTKACIGGVWPGGWTGDYYDCNGNPVRKGGMIDSLILPPIEGGKSYVARIPWTTPDNNEFSPCFESEGEYLSELWHYCVLARIVDSQEQPNESITDMSLLDFVLNFNNVVSRNVTIMGIQEHGNSSVSATGVVGIVNPLPGEDNGPYTLKCYINGVEDWDLIANVTLTFPYSFYASQTAMTWQNCHDNNYGVFDLYDSARFDDIYFEWNDNNFYPLIVDIDFFSFGSELYYIFDISFTLEDATGVFVGGEMFNFRHYPPSMANRIRLHDAPMEEIGIEQKPIQAKDILYVDVYNAQGQLLMCTTSDNIESFNLPKGIYILHHVEENTSYSVKIIK